MVIEPQRKRIKLDHKSEADEYQVQENNEFVIDVYEMDDTAHDDLLEAHSSM